MTEPEGHPPRGHLLLPHTADVIVEAWGANEVECAEEAAGALIEVCVSGQPAPDEASLVTTIEAVRSRELVEAVLDETVFALDTSELVPVAATLEGSVDGGFELRMNVAHRDVVRLTGAAPKAVVMVNFEGGDGGTPSRCRFIVDV